MLAIVTNNNWRVVANLPERHLYNLRVGQHIWLWIGSGPWQVHTGRIRSIAPGVSRSDEATTALPYVKPNTEWIRLPRRFPVGIEVAFIMAMVTGNHAPKTIDPVIGRVAGITGGVLVVAAIGLVLGLRPEKSCDEKA